MKEVISRDEAFVEIAKYFGTDEYTAEEAYYGAAHLLKIDWNVLDRAEYREIVDTIHNVTGLGDFD